MARAQVAKATAKEMATAWEKAMEQAEMTRIEANKSAHSGYCRRNAG